MTSLNLTPARLEFLAEDDIVVKNFLKRRLASTYDEFRESLSDDLLSVISQLEENPQHYRTDTEDATTQRIIDMLKVMGYTAHHNRQSGGNVDITVEVTRRNFKWLGEAKKFESVGDLREGYLQLATRYRTGMDANGVLHGGLIGYLRRPDAVGCIKDWRKHFASQDFAVKAKFDECSRRGPLGFFSEHAHKDYGLPLRVWHFCAVLHFKPEDLSGRQAATYRA